MSAAVGGEEADLAVGIACGEDLAVGAEGEGMNAPEGLAEKAAVEVGLGEVDTVERDLLEVGLPEGEAGEVVLVEIGAEEGEEVEEVTGTITGLAGAVGLEVAQEGLDLLF